MTTAPAAPGIAATASGRLLVVDADVPQTRQAYESLRQLGYEIEACASPADAIATLRSRRFDLLLTCLDASEAEGDALLSAALERDMVVVALTSPGAGDPATRAVSTGALDSIARPLRVDTALPVLNRALMVRALRAENAELARRLDARELEFETLHRTWEEFAHSIAHDLRAPLRAIEGFAGILMEDEGASLRSEARDLLRIIMTSAAKMAQLLDACARLARLHVQPVDRRPVALMPLVCAAIDEQRPRIGARRVRWVVGALPECIGDEALLRQVFVSLLSNAVKFSACREEAVIEVGSAPGTDGVVCFVRDNGIGFDMRYARRLFGLFQRMHREEDFPGTGANLAMVQGILARHGGRIWADAQVDRGATFFFVLPAST